MCFPNIHIKRECKKSVSIIGTEVVISVRGGVLSDISLSSEIILSHPFNLF